MSAPKQGRQSPEPETAPKQTEKVSEGHAGAAPSEEHAKEKSEQDLADLPSNPEHPLAKAADSKISKEARGEGVA